MVVTLGEVVWQFLIKLYIVLISDPMIMLLGVYPTDLKTCLHKTRTQMFTALFIIVKMWRTSICEWIDNLSLVYPHNEVLFSNKNKWALKPYRQGDLKCIFTTWRKIICKRLYIVPEMTIARVKRSAIAKVLRRGEEEFLGQWNCSVYCNSKNMSLCTCQNPSLYRVNLNETTYSS